MFSAVPNSDCQTHQQCINSYYIQLFTKKNISSKSHTNTRRQQYLSGVNFQAARSFCDCSSWLRQVSISCFICVNSRLTAGSSSIDCSCAELGFNACFKSDIWPWQHHPAPQQQLTWNNFFSIHSDPPGYCQLHCCLQHIPFPRIMQFLFFDRLQFSGSHTVKITLGTSVNRGEKHKEQNFVIADFWGPSKNSVISKVHCAPGRPQTPMVQLHWPPYSVSLHDGCLPYTIDLVVVNWQYLGL